MKRNNKILLGIVVMLIMNSCGYRYDEGRGALVAGEKSFLRLYDKTDLFEHFPEYDREKPTMGMISVLIPTSRNGEIFQYEFFDKDRKNVELLKKHSVLYHTNYNEPNIIIDFAGFRDSLIQWPGCNKYYKDKYPLPDFGYIDFHLGESSLDMKISDGSIYTRKRSIFPKDLEVYVVDAKAGNFWKTKSEKKNPESLKEWKYGYSRGYAISESQERIIYWTIIW